MIDWPKFPSNLPTRDGPTQGKSFENRAIANIGGVNQIRKKIIDNPDGSQTIFNSRNGFPEFITNGKKIPIKPTTNRTFVFSVYLATAGVVANRLGAALQIVKTGLKMLFASYNVANTGNGEGNWHDVWRLDRLTAPDSRMVINAASQSVQTTLSKTTEYDLFPIPYIHRVEGAYVSQNPNNALYSTLYLGISATASPTADGQKFVAIKKDGTEGTTVVPSGVASSYFYPCWSAGLRALTTGEFRYYGGVVVFSGSEVEIGTTRTAWSNIVTSLVAPLVSESSHGTNLKYQQGFLTSGHGLPVLAPYETYDNAYTGNFPPLGNTAGSWADAGNTWHYTFSYSESEDDPDYAYPGSDIALRFQRSAEGAGDVRGMYPGFGSGVPLGVFSYTANLWPAGPAAATIWTYGPFISHDITASMTFSLTSANAKIKPLLTGSFEYERRDGAYGPTEGFQVNETDDPMHPGYKLYSTSTVTGITQTSPTPVVARTYSASVSTRDYIYCDLEEDVYLTFETSLTVGQVGSDAKTHAFEMNYVLSVRGVETEWNIPFDLADLLPAAGPSPAGAYPDYFDWIEVDYANAGNLATVWPITYYPVGVFNPHFMHQGNCPWIAYTTKEEEAQGATPEIYLDLTIRLVTYADFLVSVPTERLRYKDNNVQVAPHQFIQVYDHYFCNINREHSLGVQQNDKAWKYKIFPTGSEKRLTFCNGVKGDWATKLGTGFEGNPPVTITRI